MSADTGTVPAALVRALIADADEHGQTSDQVMHGIESLRKALAVEPVARVYAIGLDDSWSCDADEVVDDVVEVWRDTLHRMTHEEARNADGPWIAVADVVAPREVRLCEHGDGWVLPRIAQPVGIGS